MNLLQFIASIVGSISWPVTVIVVVLILRRPLSTIIQSLSKVSYKDVSLECPSYSELLRQTDLYLKQLETNRKKNNKSNKVESTEQEGKIVNTPLSQKEDDAQIATINSHGTPSDQS
jgi:hypothetical protein